MITINKLNKYYEDTHVLKDISLEVKQGEVLGIIGQSGSGKSTLLRCISGLESIETGDVNFKGTKINTLSRKELRDYKKSIGMIFQSFALISQYTVYNNVALPLKCWHYDKKIINEKVRSLLDMVGMLDKIDASPAQLSGGQKQRVAIARALALDPEIILSDEATSALDPENAKMVLDLLIEINQTRKLTAVLVSHQIETIIYACDRVAEMVDGEIKSIVDVIEFALVQKLTTLRKQYKNERVKILSCAMKESDKVLNLLAGRKDCHILDLGQFETKLEMTRYIAFDMEEESLEKFKSEINKVNVKIKMWGEK